MKRLFCILISVFLLAALVIPVSAAESPEYCIYDMANLLTDEESMTLEAKAQEISKKQQCAVYFLTVDDFLDYGDGTIYDVAMEIFLYNDLGLGENRDGVMLILSMADRDYCLLAHGFGDTALTDYGKDYISEKFLDNFGSNDWFGGCSDYLTYTDKLLGQAREGKIYDRDSWITGGALWGWSFGLALVIALITCLCQRSAMKKKVVMQVDALGYLEGGSVNITQRQDRFTHTTEVRREIKQERNSGSSGGSGGHSHSSNNFSGKSGKF